MQVPWDIRWEGRHWENDVCKERSERLPDSFRIEIHAGQLGFNDEERFTVLAMLLENLGLVKVLCFLLDVSLEDGEISREDFDFLRDAFKHLAGQRELPPTHFAAALASMPDGGKDSDFDR